jgi:hypothetical protein
MEKREIKIRDFQMFYDILRSVTRMADGIKMIFDENGMEINAKNEYSKCNISTNSVCGDGSFSVCVQDLSVLVKIVQTLLEMYKDDQQSISITFEKPFLKFSSKKFKTKINSYDEDKIEKFISTKIKTQLTPKLEFTTNTALIKKINSHSFIFKDITSARVYITTEDDMQNNTIFATIGDRGNDLSNSATLELGLINSGSLKNADGSVQNIILNFDRLNILNMVPSDEIKVMVANERPVLISNVKRSGKNGAYFNIDICSYMLVR